MSRGRMDAAGRSSGARILAILSPMSIKTYSDPRIGDYLASLSARRESAQLADLRVRTLSMEWGKMQISPEQGRLLALLTQLTGATRALELGTFTGYSSLCVAEHLGEGGLLVCCDTSEEWTSIARAEWREAGLEERIDLRIAPASQTLDALIAEGQAATFDLAFVDADKTGYPAYYEKVLTLLRSGGLIAFDNMFRGGGVLDEPESESGSEPGNVALRGLNLKIYDDLRVDPAMVPIGDGLLLVRKR